MKYPIDDLIPGDRLKIKTLDYYVSLVQQGIDIFEKHGPVRIHRINNKLYVNEGTQRTTFVALNGRTEVEGIELEFEEDDARVQRDVVHELYDQSIFRFKDLVRKVKHPNKYRILKK